MSPNCSKYLLYLKLAYHKVFHFDKVLFSFLLVFELPTEINSVGIALVSPR